MRLSTNYGKAWTKTEYGKLRTLARNKKYTPKKIASTLGRSVGAVRKKAYEKGITFTFMTVTKSSNGKRRRYN